MKTTTQQTHKTLVISQEQIDAAFILSVQKAHITQQTTLVIRDPKLSHEKINNGLFEQLKGVKL